jgi:pimeloyl-ACP methyl ester carboxylesterase
MILHHSFVGDPAAPHLCFVLHGVLGSGHNFKSFIQRLAVLKPEYRFALLDLRYHGRSVGAGPPHSIEACATDLFDTAKHLRKHPRAVIGHSLGGKVALCFGRRHMIEVPGHSLAGDEAHETLTQIWTLDSDPGAQEPNHDHQVLRVFGTLRDLPGPFSSRNDALTRLQARGLSSGLCHWLVTSLKRSEQDAGELVWRFDLDGIDALLTDYFSLDLWPFLESIQGRTDGPRFDLLVAENSDRWNGDMRRRAERLHLGQNIRLHVLPDSGHWVHVDNPDGLLQVLGQNLL